MPSDLQNLVAMIPTAATGAVITPNYHNTTLDAIARLAALAEGGSGGGDVTFSQPAILYPMPDLDKGNWVIRAPGVTLPDGNTAEGWFPVLLPDKSQLLTMTVIGSKSDDNVSGLKLLRVELRRRLLDSLEDEPALISMNLRSKVGTPFRESASPNARQIDNSMYFYWVQASFQLATESDVTIAFHAFQFTCRLS